LMPGCLRAIHKPDIVSQVAFLEPTAVTLSN
jgi:hypothetical protein